MPRKQRQDAVAFVIAALAALAGATRHAELLSQQAGRWGATPAQAPRDDAAARLRALTGAHTRVVWVQDLDPKGRDTGALGGNLRLCGFDTSDGRGEREILPGPDNYSRPLLTPRGDRVVFTSVHSGRPWRCCVVGFDGRGRRELAEGFAMEVWRDPKTGVEWVCAGTKGARGKGATVGRIERFPIDSPDQRELVWDKGPVGASGFCLSADGRTASGLFPWPAAGRAELPNRGWTAYARGCWTALSPDDSRLAWVFDGSHRNVVLHAADGGSWKVGVSGAPGVGAYEVYHPRWSNHVRFVTVTGPYCSAGKPGGNQIRGGGADVEVHVGRFGERFSRIEQWVRVTSNRRGDFFPDVWVEGGEAATVQAAMQHAVGAVAERPLKQHDEWPGDQDHLVFLWHDAAQTNQIVGPDGRGGPTCRVVARGRARYHRFHDMDLAGGAFLAEDADAALLAACRKSHRLTVEAILTPDSLDQRGPARIVTFSSGASSRNFTLGQQGDQLVFRLRTPDNGQNGTNVQPVLCKLAAGKPHHVVVSYMPGLLTCFLDGRQVLATPAVKGDLSNWQAQHLLFGDEYDGGRDWSGKLEGVAIYSRFVAPAEAKQKHSLYAARLAKRKPAERVVLDGRLAEVTPTPSPKAIGAYRRCLVVYRYDVAKVVTGRCEARQVLVAHWGILDRQVVQIGRQTGKTCRLTLEAFDDHPQLESERRVSAIEELDLPLFYDVAR